MDDGQRFGYKNLIWMVAGGKYRTQLRECGAGNQKAMWRVYVKVERKVDALSSLGASFQMHLRGFCFPRGNGRPPGSQIDEECSSCKFSLLAVQPERMIRHRVVLTRGVLRSCRCYKLEQPCSPLFLKSTCGFWVYGCCCRCPGLD